jgi:membrane protease YdiL (CAAX protease family)
LNRLRNVAAWYARLPAMAAWAVSLAILFVGILLLGLFQGPGASPNVQSLKSDWSQAPRRLVAAVLIMPILETLVFQALFLDGLARLTRARWPWVFVSALAFSLGLHYQAGWFPMLVAGWGGLVFSATYLGQRDRSFARAFAVTSGVQVTFAIVGVAGAILVG